MNCVGIDISKGKSTIAVMRPFGEVVVSPFEVCHTASELSELARLLKSLDGETRVVMESTGNYHAPVAWLLHGAGRTGKQAVCIRKSGVQQGDQVVFQHGLYFGILLVLPVAGLQHEPGIFFRDISRKCEPVVKTVVGQLHGILLVGLAPS